MRRRLYAAAAIRAAVTGMVSVLLGVSLAHSALGATKSAWIIGLGLAGAVCAAAVVTLAGDRMGKRRSLIALALLGGAGTIAFALSSGFLALGFCAAIGMINGVGRDRGAALVLEQALLPATSTDQQRTFTFAWYNLLQDAGHAVGGLCAGLPVVLEQAGFDEWSALRSSFGAAGVLLLLSAALYSGLPDSRSPPADAAPRLSPETRRVLTRISLLFGIDSIAGGFLGTALLTYYFSERFGVGAGVLAVLFFLARTANAFSHLGAAWLAGRIGLVNTMVFTHLPSSLLLAAIPFVPAFWAAAGLLLLREALVEMDVPTRQSYVMALVRPEERTVASGITHLVRMGGWAIAPFVAGPLIMASTLATPLLWGASLKIGYDLLLWRSFRRIRPPEERT